MVADNPEQKIALKMYHSDIQNDHEAMAKEEVAFNPIPIVNYVSEETVIETYSQIKDEIAELFKAELATLDKEDEAAVPAAGLKANVPKPGTKQVNKKQRRQMNKRNRQRERGNMRKLKHAEDNKALHHNGESISPVKNDDMEQAMSL